MTPIFLNSSSTNYPPYPNDFHHEDHLSNNQYLSPNSQPSSSFNSPTTNMFLNTTFHDQNRIFNSELYSPHQHQGDFFGSQSAYNHETENINDEKGLQFFTCNEGETMNSMNKDQNELKWMSSKMRVMLKMKKSDHPVDLNTYSSTSREVEKFDQDHILPTSPMGETDNSSNISTSSNNNIPIRVCSDCYTTKTPLWRSGPRGPKSLCNACGIRQRKARRALAAAAENGDKNVSINQSSITPLKVKKAQHKDHKKPSNGDVADYKKRKYTKKITIPPPPPSPWPSLPSPSPSPSPSSSPSSSSPPRKSCVEEFLVSLSKNLSFYHVFPQDEKEAAILLMAISCGYADHEA